MKIVPMPVSGIASQPYLSAKRPIQSIEPKPNQSSRSTTSGF